MNQVRNNKDFTMRRNFPLRLVTNIYTEREYKTIEGNRKQDKQEEFLRSNQV